MSSLTLVSQATCEIYKVAKTLQILPVGGRRGSQASVEYLSGSTPQQDEAALQKKIVLNF